MPLISETSAEALGRALTRTGVAGAEISGAASFRSGTWHDAMRLLPRGCGPRPAEPAAGGIMDRLDEAIRRRRSVRAFDDRPVVASQLGLILRAARSAALVRPGMSLEINVALSGGWPDRRSGLFGTDESGALTLALSGESLVTELHASYVAAPVLLLICGTIAAGADGYRRALLAASSFGYSAWLAAIVLGLDGCVFGRAHGRVTSAVRSSRHPANRHLFTLAIGWPSASTSA
jgi:hypothetical protein